MPRQALPPLSTNSSCESSTRSELERLNASDTPEGQAALALAAAVDSGRSLMAAPAMVKELRATLDALREQSPKVKDGVDEFTARRTSRRSAAGM